MSLAEKHLVKDCDCSPAVHGDMPHWVYTDRLWQTENQAALERARLSEDMNGCFAFLKNEDERLATLNFELQRRGLESFVDRGGGWYGRYRERVEIIFTSYPVATAGA